MAAMPSAFEAVGVEWVMPLPANIVLRNFGLTLFLATVGINSGQSFVTTVAQTGPLMLLIGAAVLVAAAAPSAPWPITYSRTDPLAVSPGSAPSTGRP